MTSLNRREALLGVAATMAAGGANAQERRSSQLILQRLDWAGIRANVGQIDIFIDAVAPNESPGPQIASQAARRFALVTHHHGDHLDIASLAGVLGERGYLVVSEDVSRFIDHRSINLQVVRHFEPTFLTRAGGEFAAWCTPTADGLGSPQVAWIVDGGGKRFIHCGDTLWHGGWWDIARAYGPFDVAFLPINGARQVQGRFTDVGQAISMGPEEAAAAAAALGARLAVPIHYGRPSEGYIEAPDAERRFLASARARDVATRVLSPGETFEL